jgi:hypothetical protein
MPSSHFYQLDQLTKIIFAINPQSTLDVGAGFGKYGLLVREYVDIWRDGNYKNFKRRVDGIEVFKAYLNPVHKFIYNKIYIGDALKVLPNLKRKYDLVLLVDCLEHFTQKDGLMLLKLLAGQSKYILISTPKKMRLQESVFGNVHERHVFQWTKKSLGKIPDNTFFSNDRSYICLIGKGSKQVAKNIVVEELKDKLLNLFPFLKKILLRFL